MTIPIHAIDLDGDDWCCATDAEKIELKSLIAAHSAMSFVCAAGDITTA